MPDKKSIIYLAIVFIFACLVAGLTFYFWRAIPETPETMPVTLKEILTAEQIQAALSKKADYSVVPLTQEQIDKAMDVKATQKLPTLTPEEVQKALNATKI